MDEVTRNMVVAQLKNAKTSDTLHDALVSAMIAMVDCQYTTGKRVKRQGLLIAIVGLVLLVTLVCGDAEALKLLNFWRGGVS